MRQSKFILDCEMATLGSIYHDFPRLAKQSGFYFQLHTGRVNWSEIENLNVDEIIEKRNYELLERNLINVINCNLEREYDLKILDPNFVKLFKLAQLGIDYLSYCEMYLDRCVVLLQEQLTAFQEEYEALKQDSQKRSSEMIKSKRKNRTQSYQCEKCEKVFISDVYLKFHDKRRHSNPNTPISLDTSQKRCVDNSQQTEDGRKLSISTQTPDEVTNPPECEDRGILKKDHTIKIEKLEEELKDLKERLKRAESSLIEKVENSQLNQSNVLHPLNVGGPMCCNSMLMLLPSYLKQPGSGYYEINPGSQIPVLEVSQSPVNSGTNEIKPQLESKLQSNTTLRKTFGTELHKEESKSSIESTELRKTFMKELPKEENKSNIEINETRKAFGNELSKEENKTCVERTDSYPEYQCEGKGYLDYDKENVDPNSKKSNLTNLTKPLPPPRKLKKGIRPQSFAPVEAFTTDKDEIYKEEGTEGFSSRSIVHRSTPIKEPSHEENWEMLEASRENLSGINKPGSNSTESLNSKKSISIDHESKSLIKKIVRKNSPKLRRFSKNLKRSLTNLYDSVSSTEKNSKKMESESNLKTSVVNGLNNRLKELGVDPEWQGIPKKTMKQKLNILKHRRKLLSKENPMFPIIRQNIEEKIFQKIKNNLGNKKNLMNKLSKQGSMIVEDPPQQISTEDISLKDKSDFVRVKKSVMYDTDTDSESKISDSEGNFNHVPDQSTSQKSVLLEELTSSDEEEKVETKQPKVFDFSVFQVGGGSLNSLNESTQQKNVSVNKKDFFTESDSEDNSVEHSEDKIFKTLNNYLSHKNKDENCESPKNYGNTGQQLEVSHTKVESHGILKEEGLQSKLSMTGKKRVLFANYSNGIDEELSDSPIDDDLWPFKSDSEKDVTR